MFSLPLGSICLPNVHAAARLILSIMVLSIVLLRGHSGTGLLLSLMSMLSTIQVYANCFSFFGVKRMWFSLGICFFQIPLFVIWIIWKHRAQLLYSDSPDPASGLSQLKFLVHQVSLSCPFQLHGEPPGVLAYLQFRRCGRRFFAVRWQPSLTGYKMNVDGSSLGPSSSSGGGMTLRDIHGHFVAASCFFVWTRQ